MSLLLILPLTLCLWIPACLCRVTTDEEFAVLEGRSLAIPCHYEPQYAGYVKYWCHGRSREFCTSLARSDDPRSSNLAEDKVSIFDDPVQLVFTVTMKNLKEGDSGWYMCGMEVGGMWSADVVAFTNINIIHGMSVVNSRLSGEEGSSVTVECLYSERYRESEKKWCRSGDWSSCLLTDSEGNYQDTSVAISDDRTGTFTVTLKKLQMRDTGWYWCGVGQQQISVHVLVTPRPSTTPGPVTSPASTENLPPPEPIAKQSWNPHSHILGALLVCASLMFFVGFAIFAKKMWNLHKQDVAQRQIEGVKARLNDCSGDVDDLETATIVFLNTNSQHSQVVV
ncbi:polymeric immunoglobulin receptor [Sphaeramia orbicularis]|uniref:CMRF35-like molecule 8 n=1 Tax=Sphaeramia orbicularis TaxID=375764 RepID=A0A673ARP8_9TELE|nr:CMRF35-like molecule 8 [Sphaeramia orbicularis]